MRCLFGCPDIVSLIEKFLMARNFFRIFTENNPVMGSIKTFFIPEAKGLRVGLICQIETYGERERERLSVCVLIRKAVTPQNVHRQTMPKSLNLHLWGKNDLKGQHRHDQNRLSTGHGIGVLVEEEHSDWNLLAHLCSSNSNMALSKEYYFQLLS